MLEQLFPGLTKYNCTVYAEEAGITLTENMIYIPLGSVQTVKVKEGEKIILYSVGFFQND